MAGLGRPTAERAPLATWRKLRMVAIIRNGAVPQEKGRRAKLWSAVVVAEAPKVR